MLILMAELMKEVKIIETEFRENSDLIKELIEINAKNKWKDEHLENNNKKYNQNLEKGTNEERKEGETKSIREGMSV